MQIGPGKARRFEDHARDPGRFGVTGNAEDLYAFRTPSLRNVALTAPYGHAGAFADLEAYVAAHSGTTPAFDSYEVARAVLPDLPVDRFHVPMPHLLIWGPGDTALLPEATEGLEAYCADLTRIEIPGADHWVIHQETDAVAGHIRDWLQR